MSNKNSGPRIPDLVIFTIRRIDKSTIPPSKHSTVRRFDSSTSSIIQCYDDSTTPPFPHSTIRQFHQLHDFTVRRSDDSTTSPSHHSTARRSDNYNCQTLPFHHPTFRRFDNFTNSGSAIPPFLGSTIQQLHQLLQLHHALTISCAVSTVRTYIKTFIMSWFHHHHHHHRVWAKLN